jgi:hypothetical protein
VSYSIKSFAEETYFLYFSLPENAEFRLILFIATNNVLKDGNNWIFVPRVIFSQCVLCIQQPLLFPNTLIKYFGTFLKRQNSVSHPTITKTYFNTISTRTWRLDGLLTYYRHFISSTRMAHNLSTSKKSKLIFSTEINIVFTFHRQLLILHKNILCKASMNIYLHRSRSIRSYMLGKCTVYSICSIVLLEFMKC